MKKIMLGVLLAVTISLAVVAVVLAAQDGWECTYLTTTINQYEKWVVVKHKYNCVYTPADPSLDMIVTNDTTYIPREFFQEDLIGVIN